MPRVRTMRPEDVEKARRSLGYTQTTFAAALGVQQPEVSRWESGRREVPAATVAKIRALLNRRPSVVQARGPVRLTEERRKTVDERRSEVEREHEKTDACRARFRARPFDPRPACEDYGRVCYMTKGNAVRALIARNMPITEAAGGAAQVQGPAAFDAINEKYERRGRRQVVRLGDAIAVAIPPGRPFCLDAADINALNETTPGQHYGPFEVPDVVHERRLSRQYEELMRELADDDGELDGELEVVEADEDVPF